MIKVSTLQENITIFNMYIPNNRTLKSKSQKINELQIERDKSIIIVGNLNTPLVIDRSHRQKMSNNTVERNSTINPLDLIDTKHFIQHEQHTHFFLFKLVWNIYQHNHTRGQKTDLIKCKRLEVIYDMFSDHSGNKLEINDRKIN